MTYRDGLKNDEGLLMEALLNIKNGLEKYLDKEFKGIENQDLQRLLENFKDAFDDLMVGVEDNDELRKRREESRVVIREKIDEQPLFHIFSGEERDMIANLAIKYDKEIPSEPEFRENVYRRIMNLKDRNVLVLAYGRSNIQLLGENLGSKEDVFERGLDALMKDSFLPQNLEYTYSRALDTVYKYNHLLMAFVIDYFRNVVA